MPSEKFMRHHYGASGYVKPGVNPLHDLPESPLLFAEMAKDMPDSRRCLEVVGHICHKFTVFDHRVIYCGRAATWQHRCGEHQSTAGRPDF